MSESPQYQIDVSFRQRYKRVRAQAKSTRGKILDCGCGAAVLLSALNNHKELRVGIDISFNSLRQGVMRDRELCLVCASASNLPFRSHMFQCVIMMEVLEHLPRVDSALKEVSNVMEPDALLLVSVPNAEYPFAWDPINKILTEAFHASPIRNGIFAGFWYMHYRLYTIEELLAELESGFHIIAKQGVTHAFLPLHPLILTLYVNVMYHLTHRPLGLPRFLLYVLDRMDKFNDKTSTLKGATTLLVSASPKGTLARAPKLSYPLPKDIE